MRLSLGNWVRKNLFNTWYNALVTVIIVVVAAIIIFYSGRFILVTGQWEAVRSNLTLFMVGYFPRKPNNEMWRLVVQMYIVASAIGLVWGTVTARSQDRAEETGTSIPRPTPFDMFRRYWAILLLLAVILGFTETIRPTLFTLTTIIAGLSIRALAIRLPRSARRPCWYMAAFMGIASFQVVSGTTGNAWWWTAGLAAYVAMQATANLEMTIPWHRTAIRITAIIAAVVIVRFIYLPLDKTTGVGWDEWSGLYLTLVASGAAIIMAFPLSLMLALGRRSSLPMVRYLCVGYIEIFRGVPFIALLFMASTFIGYFLNIDTPLSLRTRAIIAFTIFSSAYLAEVVRGGLQAVPKGQIEAGQAIGLQPLAIMRLIMLPQALRAVIPALVGQCISLFKDSSLLAVISIFDFYHTRKVVHAQQEFLTSAIAETLVFVAFVYWAISYTMSKESQRVERRLGVGER